MFEDRLIAAVRMHNCLYDQSLKSYRSNRTKHKAWFAVAASVGEDVERCQARWKSLRDRFAKEIAKQLKPDYIPRRLRWMHFNSLKFLTPHYTQGSKRSNFREDTCSSLKSENTMDNIVTENEDMTTTSFKIDNNFIEHQPCAIPDLKQSSNNTCMPTVQAHKRKKFLDAGERLDSMIDALTDLISKTAQARAKSQHEHFLMVVDEFLQKLPEDVQDRLKIDILNLVIAEVSSSQTDIIEYEYDNINVVG